MDALEGDIDELTRMLQIVYCHPQFGTGDDDDDDDKKNRLPDESRDTICPTKKKDKDD